MDNSIISAPVIDLDTEPRIPYSHWKVIEHRKGGQYVWNPEKIELFLHADQKKNCGMDSNKLRNELTDVSVFNANLLDFLMCHKHLIPNEWKKDANGKTIYVYFWGTIYKGEGRDGISVRYLCFFAGEWKENYGEFQYKWLDNMPTAVEIP